jgi:hypothetical protein
VGALLGYYEVRFWGEIELVSLVGLFEIPG